jgi:hypothetical protein
MGNRQWTLSERTRLTLSARDQLSIVATSRQVVKILVLVLRILLLPAAEVLSVQGAGLLHG